MIWGLSKKQMGVRKELACLSLLLLMLLQLESSCFAEGYGRFSRFKVWLNPAKPRGVFKGNAGKDGDDVFAAEKRRVYTGPNPLHNR
ncbi:hypothetical protein AAG906_018416 [Vitis piasezkii]